MVGGAVTGGAVRAAMWMLAALVVVSVLAIWVEQAR